MNRRTALLALGVTACATQQSILDGSNLAVGQGLLALKLMSNANGSISFVPYTAESGFGSRLAENLIGAKGVITISQLEQFFVLPVDAGEYMWSRFAAIGRQADLRSSNRFEVKPGTITYVGHIRTFVNYDTLHLDVFDRVVEMRDHLREQYPKYYESLRFFKALAQLRPRPV